MPSMQNLSLLTKINLAIGVILLFFFAVTAWMSYSRKQEATLREAVDRARLIASETVNTREYLSKHIRLGQVELSDERYALIPVVASNRVGQLVAKDQGFRLRQVSERFRNPNNAPDPFEAIALQQFGQNPYLRETYEIVDQNGEKTFRYLQPFRADESCLVCHGRPEEAPEFIRNRFPVETDKAYNYSIGEIIGAVSISLPMTRLHDQMMANLRNYVISMAGVFLGLILCLSFLLRRTVTRPITLLSKTMARVVRTGRFDQVLPKQGGGEIGTLIDSFNQMAEHVGESARLLETSEQRLRALTDSARDAIVSFLPDGKLILFNHAAERLFGYDQSDVLGMDVLRLVDPECADLHQTGLIQYLEQNHDRLFHTVVQAQGRHKGGGLISVEISLSEAVSEGHAFYTAIIRPVEETDAFPQ